MPDDLRYESMKNIGEKLEIYEIGDGKANKEIDSTLDEVSFHIDYSRDINQVICN